MKKYGNILITRRVVATLCLFLVSLFVLIPLQSVKADTVTKEGSVWIYSDAQSWYHKNEMKFSASSDSPIFSFVGGIYTDEYYDTNCYGIMSLSPIKYTCHRYIDDNLDDGQSVTTFSYNGVYFVYYTGSGLKKCLCDVYFPTGVIQDISEMAYKYLTDGVLSDGMQLDVGGSYKPKDYDRSLGFLAGVELQQIDDRSKVKKGSPDDSGPMESIIYNDQTTTGVDLKNGDYKIEVAWANAYLNAKSTAYYAEDKKKTSICEFDAKLNCKSADSLKRYYYNVLDANKKCKDNSTEGFEPSMFTIITKHLKSQPTYWYRIVTKDNKYSGWVKLGIKGGEVDDITFPQDTYDNEDNIVDADHGGYHKDNSKKALGVGDSKEEAIKDSVADSQRKDDNNVINNGSSKDLWDSLKEFVKGVESVPIMIADLFSFLPSWCLGLVASGFALMIALMIINFIKP